MIIRLVWDFKKLSGSFHGSGDSVPHKISYDLSSDVYWAIKNLIDNEDSLLDMDENSSREMSTYQIDEKTYAVVLLRLP